MGHSHGGAQERHQSHLSCGYEEGTSESEILPPYPFGQELLLEELNFQALWVSMCPQHGNRAVPWEMVEGGESPLGCDVM